MAAIRHANIDPIARAVERRVSDQGYERDDNQSDEQANFQSGPSLKKFPISRNFT